MSFFYDLNKKLDSIRATPEVTHQQLNERDMSRAAKGYEKYGKQGMEALAKAGREGKALDPIRKKYDKYDEGIEDRLKDLDPTNPVNIPAYKRKAAEQGRPVKETDKKPEQKTTEAAKYRAPKYKDKLYTQEPPDYTYGPDMDDAYYNPKPDDYAGRKRKIGGGEFPSTDPLKRGQGIGRSGIKNNILDRGPRKGMPSRDQISSLKGSIKAARGTHAEPNLPEAGAPMTAKQKSFAKLAPPADKITFADKIAGAKKEVDEMLGDVAAEAMRSALGGGRGRDAEMDEDNAFDYKSPRKDAPKVGSVERGHKHDIKHTATGRVVTRRTDDQGLSVDPETDDEGNKKQKQTKAGRPEGSKNVSSKAKVFQRKSKLMTREGEDDPAEKGEYDREGDMALDDIDTIESAANELQSIIDADDNLPEWVQSKINKAMDYLDTARDYMAAQGNDQEPIAEKAVSKQQQKFMGMAHAMQKGEKIKGASKELKKVARTMKPKDTEDFAKTKHKGLPDKVDKKEVDENSKDGRLTTTQTGPGKTSTSSSTGRISTTLDKGKVDVKPAKSGGMSFGKGIYDSMNRELETMIAESMSINMSNSTEGGKSLTVTATDEDALKLAMMLKSAGVGGHDHDMHSGMAEAVDENAPDYPTNTQTSSDALQYAGGINKPKTDVAGDGQTTIPNTAVHTQDEDALRRMIEMAGLAEAAKPDFLDMDKDGNKKESMKDAADDMNEEDSVKESIQRMREMAGIREAKKEVDEADMEEGNKFAHNVLKAKAAGKKQADLDGDGDMEKVRESIFALTNQWKTYKG